ncbi:hypothetical protein P0F65_20870 [Sphingomonas sp. I4]
MLSRFALVPLLSAMLIAIGLLPATAGADDIAATARGVVRVVTIAMVDDEVAGFGHGSGFAVAPNRIVTNAHVVELAERYPDNVVIGVVPSEGSKSYQGRVIAYDLAPRPGADRGERGEAAPAALFTGPVTEGIRSSRWAIPAMSTWRRRSRRRTISGHCRRSGRRAWRRAVAR